MKLTFHATPPSTSTRPLGRIFLLFAVSIAFAAVPVARAVQVIPGVYGFGTATAAGRGGTVYKVTNLNDSGTGSLRAALEASGPRIVIFETSGTIDLADNIVIESGDITVAGQSAPSPGITLKGAAIRIKGCSNVLIQHLRIRIGDLPTGPAPGNRDAIQINGENETTASNIVIDHCSFSWSIDENAQAWGAGCQDITFRLCIFSESLYDSIHPEGLHSMGLILGGGGQGTNTMVQQSIFAHNNDRNPLVQSNGAVITNNVIYNWGNGSTKFAWGSSTATHAVVGNYYKGGPNTNSSRPIIIQSNLVSGAKIYVDDTIWEGHVVSDDWDVVTNGSSFSPRVSTEPLWPAGYVALPSTSVLDHVLANAGARPRDRDAVDERIVREVREGEGSLIDSQIEVGGWPTLTQNIRALTIPNNPHGDQDGDGYTNIEEWLHGMAAEVEGAVTDNFEDGNANGWTPDGLGTWSIATDSTNVLQQSDNTVNANRVLLDSTVGWTDQTIEADIKPLSFNGSNRFFGVVGRYQDAQNYYYLVLRSGGTVELKKLVAGTATTLVSAGYTVTAGNWYTLKLEIIGTTLNAYVNGKYELSYTDTQFVSGKAGLLTYYTAAAFDDVIVYPAAAVIMPFADDFEDGDATGWSATGGTWSVVSDGTDVYRQSDNSVGARSTIIGGNWRDQIVEADLKALSFGTGGWMGLMIRYIDSNNYYYVRLGSGNTIDLRKMVAGVFTNIASASFTVASGTWYPLKVRILGNSLKVFVDGQLLLAANDSDLEDAGTAGLQVYRAAVSYDDALITAP